MSAQDGGPAFPSVVRFGAGTYDPIQQKQMARNEASQHSFQGMSLRDWLAGQALACVKRDLHDHAAAQRIASFAYAIADAMLVERAKP